MTYDPTTPGPADRISDTQLPIQTNFDQANTIFNEDHFTYNDASGAPPPPGLRGFHRKSVFSELAITPTAFASIGTVFSQDSDTRTDLFYRYDTGALGNSKVFPLTAIKVMAAFDGTTAIGVVLGAGSIFQAYNINTITRTTNELWTVAFADPLDTNAPNTTLEYIVLLGGVSDEFSYNTPTRNDSIVIRSQGISARLSFAILTL